MLIPRIFHQIWVGPDPYPKELEPYRQSWLALNPGWEMRFWTEDDLPDDLRRPEARERLRIPAERADILRLEVLWREGGVYMDTDFECLRPIEPLIEALDFFGAYRKLDRINNAFIGSVAGHPILDRALTDLKPTETFGYDKGAAGPTFLGGLLRDYPDAKIFEADLFYPRTAATRRTAYAIHHKSQTWKEAAYLREELDRFKRKLQKTQDEAHEWRLRAERAEGGLQELEQSPDESAPAPAAAPANGGMRILFFTWRWPLRRFIGLITELDRRGHEVVVVYPRGRPKRLPRKLRVLSGVDQEFYDEVSSEPLARAIALLRHTRDYAWYLTPDQEVASFNRRRALDSLVATVSGGAHGADPAWPDPLVPAVADPAVVDEALAELERRIPADPGVVEFIRSQRPDVVLVTPLVHQGAHQNEVVKAARELGVPTGFPVYSWDNLSNKGRVHVVPDRTFVWNELQRREAVELQGIDRESVVVTGAVHWDSFFARSPRQDRDDFCRGHGFDPAQPIVLYLGSTASVCRNEPVVVERWLDAVRTASGALASANFLIRWHPSQKRSLAHWRPTGERVSLSANPHLADQGLFDELHHAAAVVGLNTSAAIEAAIVGRPVFTFGAGDLAPGQQGTLHFYYLLRDSGGVVSYAETLEEHVAQLERGIEEGYDAEALRAFCEFFVRPHGLDRPVTPILIDAIEELGQRAPDERPTLATNRSTASPSPASTRS